MLFSLVFHETSSSLNAKHVKTQSVLLLCRDDDLPFCSITDPPLPSSHDRSTSGLSFSLSECRIKRQTWRSLLFNTKEETQKCHWSQMTHPLLASSFLCIAKERLSLIFPFYSYYAFEQQQQNCSYASKSQMKRRQSVYEIRAFAMKREGREEEGGIMRGIMRRTFLLSSQVFAEKKWWRSALLDGDKGCMCMCVENSLIYVK